jgi:hypothetical protein
VQAAVKIVLEPIFEADMLPCSFGSARGDRRTMPCRYSWTSLSPDRSTLDAPTGGAGGGWLRRTSPTDSRLERVELGAGVRPFPAHDDAHALGPAGQVQQPGQFGHVGPSRTLPSTSIASGHERLSRVAIAARTVSVTGHPTE